jgi:PAS domain S-box-containing protein
VNDDAPLALLKAHLESLSREKESALQALHAASTLGQFETSYSRLATPVPILAETAKRVEDMISLSAWAFFLVDETTQDFSLAHAETLEPAFDPEAEIEALIADHSFAWALDTPGPSFFTARGGADRLVLHPLATPSRTRGMFVARLADDERRITDISLTLLTVVMNACAQALESYVLYRQLAEINRDLERKVEERTRQLRESAQQVRAILDSIQAGVVVIDAETNIIEDMNPAAARMTGLDREDAVGRSCFDTLCPSQRGDCPILDRGQCVNSVERVLRTQDGREIPILKTAILATLRGRRMVVESFVDLTEQKKLAQLKEDVERIIRHDLKSPLTGIIGLPDVLLSSSDLTEDQREILMLIQGAGAKMLAMIDLSLGLFKMETGSYQPRPVPVDILAAVAEACADLGQLAASRKVGMAVHLDGQPAGKSGLAVFGEELLLSSILSNLIKNAVEASAEGDVVDILLTTPRAGGDVTVTVRNPGVIPEGMRSRFFEKYATSKEGGTGLGAYSARLMTEAMGGAIGFTTSAAQGTSLIVTLPTPPAASD